MEASNCRKVWNTAQICHKFQHVCGVISAVLFTIALLSLFDGLQSRMRAGSQELTLVPGETQTISGPCPVKNPVVNDVLTRKMPPDSPLTFRLDDFYSGYWFGSGMWRGNLKAEDDAQNGVYAIYISFRGASAQTIQKYIVKIYETPLERQAGSRSILTRILAVNPFILAAIMGFLAFCSGMLTYIFGMNFSKKLASLGLVEIYRIDPVNETVWCIVPKGRAPISGQPCHVINLNGEIISTIRAGEWKKGKLSLHCLDARPVSMESLVCLDNVKCRWIFTDSALAISQKE